MAELVGVRFKQAGKVYDFDSVGIPLEVNDHVVVETAQGLEVGQVAVAPKTSATEASEAQTPLKPVLRKATAEDLQRCQELEGKVAEALDECGKLVEKMNLPMKLLSADYSLDGNRLTVYFSSVDRVDFRDLVRELARRLKVRVEMRQTGPRDEARMCGGCGRCGRPLCCSTFLGEFAPVAMKMAKEQGLPLNPMKISGVCGRLMCCLGYENELYKYLNTTLPKRGAWVNTAQGRAKVLDSNPLKQTVLVLLETDATAELPVAEVTIEPKGTERPAQPRENPPKVAQARPNRPEAARTEGPRPDASGPQTTRAETTRREPARPGQTRPGMARTEPARPEAPRPQATMPEAAKQEPAMTEQTGPEAPRPEPAPPEGGRAQLGPPQEVPPGESPANGETPATDA